MKIFFVYASLLLASALVAEAEVVKIELPMETAVYKSGAGGDLANAQCLTCHSADYVLMQPPMSATFWKVEVDKMIGKYGAPVPTNLVSDIVGYLTENYGVVTNAAAKSGSTVVTQVTAPNPEGALDGKKIATVAGCLNCHAPNVKIIGPAYKDVAAKYKGNPDALAKIAHQISNGGSGQWGVIPMPPFKQLSDAEVQALGTWIMQQ